MSTLQDYLLGQLTQTTRSLESETRTLSGKVDKLSEEVRDAIAWAQRLILLGVTWAAALGFNLSPEEAGKALASFLHGFK